MSYMAQTNDRLAKRQLSSFKFLEEHSSIASTDAELHAIGEIGVSLLGLDGLEHGTTAFSHQAAGAGRED